MIRFVTLATVVLSQCSSIKVHREWRELNKQEQTNYLSAIKCLRDKPSKLKGTLPQEVVFVPISRWDDFTYVHLDAQHRNPEFLPWHRVFLALLDKVMEEECGYDGIHLAKRDVLNFL